MERELKQELHVYCKNREERRKRYDNKLKHNKGGKYCCSSKSHKSKKEWK